MKTPIARITLMLISILFFVNHNLNGQTRHIQGRVIDEDLQTIPRVRIQTIDTLLIGETDIDGRFKISIPQETDKLLLNFIGMEWTTIQLPIGCDTLEIIMMVDAIYDFMSSKKIDRLRKRRFNKLPELHFMAFKKGLFFHDTPCYINVFKPYKPQLVSIHKQLTQFRCFGELEF